jgi:hypothetical protein
VQHSHGSCYTFVTTVGSVCDGGLVEFSAQRQKRMLQPYHSGERLLQVF